WQQHGHWPQLTF
nr:immunoglobulin light chain junction region [Macaca mulatta]